MNSDNIFVALKAVSEQYEPNLSIILKKSDHY